MGKNWYCTVHAVRCVVASMWCHSFLGRGCGFGRIDSCDTSAAHIYTLHSLSVSTPRPIINELRD